MKIVFSLTLVLMLLILISGCSEEAERENPLDAQNKRTGGALLNIKAQAGESQVVLSWSDMGIDGIAEYRIYRAHRVPALDQFKQVATVQADIQAESVGKINEYSYVDKGLQNDGDNVYYYRISYIDRDGREVPDPANPLNLPADWFALSIIPSQAPPVPDVKVMEDTDLAIRLIWEGYAKTAPTDLAGFKIYSAMKAEEGMEQASLKLVETIDDPKVEMYVDGNDYASFKINFYKDGTSKLYRVTAFDIAGVESDSPVLQGTSPNLPPSPPAQIKGTFFIGLNTYDVRIEWRKNLEPDVEGYKVYALLPDGTREFKEWRKDPNENVSVLTGERFVIVEGEAKIKQYFVTAYDNTKRDDGKNDESGPSDLLTAK